jgi:hypothetical protein
MVFDIGIWWHWAFIFAATLGSAWSGCRVFAEEYALNHHLILTPVYRFFAEIAGSFAGWMAMWKLVPRVADCSGAQCVFDVSFGDVLLFLFAVLGVFGQIPTAIERSLTALTRPAAR